VGRADTASAESSFPEGFLWGVATAAHQIEGGNVNNDSWAREHDPNAGYSESSGDACDSRHRWREDIELIAAKGLGGYRFSLEWSRIEPAEGEFSNAAMDYYRRICAACRERNIVPVVTFHHFTTPTWLTERGGWEAADAPELFSRFVTRAAAHLGDLIGWACTINELNLIGVRGYDRGPSSPELKDSIVRHLAINEAMVRAHRRGVDALRSGPGDFPVGLTLSMDEMVAEPGGEGVLEAAREILEDRFFRATEGDDFIGVQCYSRVHFGPGGQAPNDPGVPITQMGYEYWPQGVEHCARRAAAMTGIPVLLTESGIATEDDAERITYLGEVLRGVRRALDDGVDIRGYFVWSLLDNFEWSHGFGPKFGLHSVDRETFARRPKPSASWFGAVARANSLVAPPRQGGVSG
jgi:beta-glucosidase